jgi:hypothetical protein
MNELDGQTLRNLYDALDNKEVAWMLMRYISVLYDVIYNISLELHHPRNSCEFYTFNSDRYWAKVIYALHYLSKNSENTEVELLNQIHVGSRINLINHWYNILKNKKYINDFSLQIEIKYYLYSIDTILKLNKIYSPNVENSKFKIFLTEDKRICYSIYNIKNSINNYEMLSNLLLNQIIKKCDLYVIEKFYKYLTGNINDPCKETENKNDIVSLISEYL